MSIQAFLLLATAGLGQDAGKTPTAEEVLQAALKQRRDITRAAVTLKYSIERPTGKNPKREGAYKIRMDGERLRADWFYARRPNDPITRDTLCRDCEKDKHYVIYLSGLEMPARLGKLGDPQQNQLTLVDPRVLGLIPTAFETLFYFRIDTLLGQTDRTKPVLERGKWKGHDCYIVRYTSLTGTKGKIAIWVVPSMDYSVARVDIEHNAEDSRAKAFVECDMERYGKPGVWYPKSCTFESRHDGKLFMRDAIEVSDVTLNEPIPADTFRLVGMDIPPGTGVVGTGVPVEGSYVWDGKNIVRQKAQPVPEMPIKGPPSNRTWLLVLGGVLALTASTTVWLFFRRRKVQAARV